MLQETVIMDDKAINRAIARISYEIIERNKGIKDLVIVGIISRGTEIASRIAQKIQEVENKSLSVGFLDITDFRDDKKSSPKAENKIDNTEIPFDIDNKKVILVDDVIYTGRSVRAAIDALMYRGRPLLIELAVLIDRGHREIPISADFVGKNLPTSRDEKVKVMVKPFDQNEKVVIEKNEI
ncbi:MAG: bifunctional pyr operon transcriptional regulator/uracil phosphoribosyltransferase PyrR [Oscillospiraceae bacterium]